MRRPGKALATGGMLAVLAASGAKADDDVQNPQSMSVAGAFSAALSVSEQHTDNLFFTRSDRLADWLTIVAPSLGYVLAGERGRLGFGASAEIGRFASFTNENYEDFRLNADGVLRIDPMLFLVGGASFGRNHEARNSPDDVNGATPTEYWQTSAYAAGSKAFGQTVVKLGVTFDRYDFEDVAPAINNDDRDRDTFTAGVRLTQRLTGSTSVFAEMSYDQRAYRDDVDDAGFDRDSRGLRGAAGLRYRIGSEFDIEAYGGIIYQGFDDARFKDIRAPDYGGRVTWRPAQGTTVTGAVERALEETTLADASSYLRTLLSLSVSQVLRADTRVYGGVSFSEHDFQGIDREENEIGAWLGVRRYLSGRVYLGGEFAYRERESNFAEQDYTESRVTARLGVDTDKAFEQSDIDASPVAEHAGLYLGVRGGVSHLGTMLDGPRGGGPPPESGSLVADFGDFGGAGNVFAGFGVDLARWYLGLEADAGLADLRWDHSRAPDGRVFSVEREADYGVSALAGRRLTGGSLLYARAGVRFARFATNYIHEAHTVFDERTVLGFEYGLGARAPVAPHVTLSMEYAHAAFDDYAVGAGGKRGPDNFVNSENGVRFGLAYHLQQIAGTGEPAAPADFSGAYAGVQVGHGALASLTSGPREDSTLVADFGDSGVTGGVFAGHNIQRNALVLGGELEAELSHTEWNHQRLNPGGDLTARNFSVAKVFTIGAALRAGYVFQNAALVYVRAGIAASRLDIDFQRGMDAAVSRSGLETGIRVGGGMEVPASESLAFRLDYTYTDYGKQKLDTPDGGTERYETADSLFRFGLIYRR